MLHELREDQYQRVLPLFSGKPLTYFQIVLRAIVEGNTSGRLWADDPAAPNTMLMWDEGPILGLAGNASNSNCNEELLAQVNQEIAPAVMANGYYGFKMFYTGDWGQVTGRLFRRSSLQKRDRSIFSFEKLKIDHWRNNIPHGCEVRQLDFDLLKNEHLENLDRVKEEIDCCWASLSHFFDKGLGFCLVTDDKIAAWCTAEYASGTDRGIGIETVEEYQGRGFATLTACAFVEHCTSTGLTPYWDAWKRNLPSIAVAEKVGFKKMRDYSVFLGRFTAN